MNVAILSINIGTYTVFFKDFYETAEKYYLPEDKKEYFVFTDVNNIDHEEADNVHLIYQENMGWPLNTMKRFHMFMGIADRLKQFDYIFYINANMYFTYPWYRSFINPEKDLIVYEGGPLHNKPIETLPFEKNPKSNAYIAPEDYHKYVRGGFIGGKVDAFMRMSQELDELTEEDLRNNIVAVVHDESFINMYVTGRTDVQCLGWQYMGIDNYVYPYNAPMVLKDKNKYIPRKKRLKAKDINNRIETIKLSLRNIKWWFLIKIGAIPWVEVQDKDGNYLDNDVPI